MSAFLEPANRLPQPIGGGAFRRVTVWLEEAMFGHRLWARQTPWLLVLEFLMVAEALHRRGELLGDSEATGLHYELRYRMALRNVLFNNDALTRVSEQSLTDDAAWEAWLAQTQGEGVAEFGYLRERFPSFRDFAELVGLIRRTALEPESNRRWSSRFIFPFGVDAIYPDVIVKNDEPSRDRNNFGRTGELVYLMLSRSAQATALRAPLAALFEPGTRKNRLVARLKGPNDDLTSHTETSETFLPYRSHPAFDRLGEDWVRLFALELPEQDAFAHLAPLAALHVMLYQLETAAAHLGRDRPHLVCELIAPSREFIRRSATASYQDNDALTRRALESQVDEVLASDEWRTRTDAERLSEAERLQGGRELLADRFSYEDGDARNLADLETRFRTEVEDHHDQSAAQVHAAYGRGAGLVSRRGAARLRYAPTDDLLKTLVVARVPRRLELAKFLEDLHRHYGLVIGPAEAEAALPADSFDLSTFERNRQRLEARLARMGLLNRLSDGCATTIKATAASPASCSTPWPTMRSWPWWTPSWSVLAWRTGWRSACRDTVSSTAA